MKIVVHQRIPKIDEIDLHFEPMTVFVTPSVELIIERGDTLIEVARAIRPHMTWFDFKTIKQIVAFYFAMGERAARKRFTHTWKRKEYRARRDRAYLEKIPRITRSSK